MLRSAERDADLVAQATTGDLDAFEHLVVRHRTRLYELARQLVHEREAAQDVVQEALLRAYRALPSLQEAERFGPWVNTIVRRLGQQWLRNGRHRPEPVDGEVVRGLPHLLWNTAPDAPSAVVLRVRAALAVLTERERQVMILHYLEGLSCEEIASRLHLTNPSVRRLLHYSRRKVRTEAEQMKQTETIPRGPRRLAVWMNGGYQNGPGKRTLWDYTKWPLAQSILLTANKVPKTIPQLAAQLDAHEVYVQQMVEELAEMSLLSSPKATTYLTTFIAFDAADWRRLIAMLHEPAGAVAQQLAAAKPSVQAAFAKTPLAHSGWTWEQIEWPLYATIIGNVGPSRHLPHFAEGPYPERPDGGRYWIGGYEHTDDLPKTWMNGLHNHFFPGFGYGWCMHRDIHREKYTYFSLTDGVHVVKLLTTGPRTEADLLAHLGEETERWRVALAELVQQRTVTRDSEQYRLSFPIFRQGDSEAFLPAVDAALTSVVDQFVVPTFTHLDTLLDDLGYRALRDQYPLWHGWLSGFLFGESVHFLYEQGILVKPPDPAPPSFGLIAWEENLPLLSFD